MRSWEARPDAVNSLKWDNLNDPVYQYVADYYAGLIEFRKAHPALRMTSSDEVNAHITSLTKLEFNVVACQINAMMLVKEATAPKVSESQPSESGGNPLPAPLGAMCAGLLAGVLVYKKKK